MMRSMYSGVAGLKTHQTKMDVIGNNIANVNTTAYKASSINFSELMYQTTSKASGPNATTGRAGVNAKQLGLGVQSAAITTKITSAGATQTTGNPFDIKINGESFFVVSDGKSNYFTRDGSFYVDGAGNLAMSSNGYNVMGWGVDQTTQTIKKDTVQALRIMSAANMTYPPEATTEGYVEGILDKNEPDAATTSGKTLTLGFYDALGYSYTAKFAIHETTTKGSYAVELADILDSEGNSIVDTYNVNSISDIASFGAQTESTSTEVMKLPSDVTFTYDTTSNQYKFTKTVGMDAAFSDYSTKKISGTDYEVDPNITPAANPWTATTQVDVVGTATLDKDTLEKEYGLVYVQSASDIPTGAPALPTGVTIPAYYYQDAVTGTGKWVSGKTTGTDTVGWDNVLSQWKTSTSADIVDANDATYPGSLVVDSDGNLTVKVKDKFTAANGVTYTPPSTFEKELDAREAYGLTADDDVNVAPDGSASVTHHTKIVGNLLNFDVDTGKFVSIAGGNSVKLDFNTNATTKSGGSVSLNNFSDINIDFSNVTWYNNGGSSTITATAGTEKDGLGSGRKLGQMSGVSIQNNGEIYASYDNGMTKLLGQIAVAKFANAAGLEKAGDNLYSATLNSGEFDGIGVDITADGAGSMATGALEMSNVDLSSEFTEMITTQRGFQANSRIITVSDTLLEELVNLKR